MQKMENTFLKLSAYSLVLFMLTTITQAQSKPEETKRTPGAIVTIVSDGETWIIFEGPTRVPHHKLTESTFVLEPGEYTIKGRKVTFETVVKKVKLKPGKKNKKIKIFCTEPWKSKD